MAGNLGASASFLFLFFLLLLLLSPLLLLPVLELPLWVASTFITTSDDDDDDNDDNVVVMEDSGGMTELLASEGSKTLFVDFFLFCVSIFPNPSPMSLLYLIRSDDLISRQFILPSSMKKCKDQKMWKRRARRRYWQGNLKIFYGWCWVCFLKCSGRTRTSASVQDFFNLLIDSEQFYANINIITVIFSSWWWR